MKKVSSKDILELEVSDFGPIVEANIDLRPLTVFVGPSNTGKSYLAILIYSLQKYYNSLISPYRRLSPHSYWRVLGRHSELITEDVKESIISIVDSRSKTGTTSLEKDSMVIPVPVLNLIRSRSDEMGTELRNEIGRSFGITDNISPLIRKGSSMGARIAFRRRGINNLRSIDQKLTLRQERTELITGLSADDRIAIDFKNRYIAACLDDISMNLTDDQQDHGQFLENMLFRRVIISLAKSTLQHMVGPLRFPAFYLPADRTGVMHAHSAVVSAMLGSAPMAGPRPTDRTSMLSGVLSDFLRQLIELDSASYRRPKPSLGLDRQIEKDILGGSIRVDRSELIDYPSFNYHPDGWREQLPLMRASSMVSELAPVVLYLRYMVSRDSVLIIEEPESHLHPEMQVAFTRQLAAMVRAGIRVVVTTHSEWVLEELSNLVLASQLSKVRRRAISGGRLALNTDEVGAWVFRKQERPRGAIVSELKLNQSGLYSSIFDSVSAATHNDWARIADLIEVEK